MSEVAPRTPPVLRGSGVRREFGGLAPVVALDHADVSVGPGEIVALTGPSGSGKSTLLQIMGCLDRPTSGEVEVAGRSTGRLSDRELAEVRVSALGYVFQDFHLIATKTAAANVAVPLAYLGIPFRERYARAARTLEAVGLGPRLDHRPGELSGGEKQRVAIARALVNEPTALIADEPTGNLDSRTEGEVLDLLGALAEEGIAILVATHSEAVASWAHRVVTLVDGRTP